MKKILIIIAVIIVIVFWKYILAYSMMALWWIMSRV